MNNEKRDEMDEIKKTHSLLLPSIADILFVSILLYLSFSAGMGLLADADTGYHIRAGEFIINTLSIPRHDIFSFLSPPISWTAHEWLSEVVMALIHKAFGLTGVVIFFAFVIALVYSTLFKTIKAYRNNIILAVFVVTLVIASSEIHWLARPHIFSLFLMVIWYYLLEEYQCHDRNYLYLFPPLMLLWINLHAGFIAGFILIGVYLFGNLLKAVVSKNMERERWKTKSRLLGLTMFACLVVSLINPYGYHILLFPLKLTSNKFIMDNVVEFMSPNFHEPMTFRYLLFLMIAILAISNKGLNLIELALISLFSYMALYSARYIPLFGIIAAPIIIRQAELVLEESDGRFVNSFKKRAERIASVDESAKRHLWTLMAVLIVIIFAASGKIEYRFDEKIKPVAAVEFLKREHVKGNMFNNDEFGDYIIYAAWPEYKVFFDGRSDMYGVERMKEYFKVARIEPGWEDVLKKYNINWIIYDAKSALSRYLLVRDDWRLVYADKVANIFVRNIPEYREMIERYKKTRPVPGE